MIDRAGWRRAVLAAIVLGYGLAPATAGQQLPAPREMGLGDAGFHAPDAAPLRHPMSGGLTAYVVQDRLVPLVRFTALIGAGAADSADVASFAAALQSGPASLAGNAFASRLAAMAALFEVAQTETETRVTLEVPTDDASAALEIFAALLRAPARASVTDGGEGAGAHRPTADRGEAAPTGESGPVLYEGSLDEAVGLLRRHVYPQHPYTGDLGAPDSAAPKSFRERFVTPSNIVLAISGDLDPAAMRRDLDEAFAGWAGSHAELPVHPLPPPATARRVFTYPVDKLQGWVAIGHELPPIPLQDEAPLLLMNYVLGGGHFDTRLFRATRDRRGLTNDDSGFPEPGFRGPGLYSFRTYGRPEAVRLLIHLTLAEIERIRAAPVSEEELFVARGALADGDFSLWFRNGAATATTYAREWLRYRDHSRTATWQERVRAVTAQEVLDAARRYLHPERLQIVVVGPIEAIEAAPAREGEASLAGFER